MITSKQVPKVTCVLQTWNIFRRILKYHIKKILCKIKALLLKVSVQFSHTVMSNSATPWTAVLQASLSITNSRSLLKLMSIESVMPSNHFILCHPLLLPPSIFPSIRVFSNESALGITWPKDWRFSILPVNSQDLFPLGLIIWISLQSKGLSRVFSNTTGQKHQFFSTQLSL